MAMRRRHLVVVQRLQAAWAALLAAMIAAGATGAAARAQFSGGWIASPYSSPGFNNRVTVLYSWDPDGAGPLGPVIVAGGSMTASGATPLGYMAKWDPAANAGAGAWVPVGSGPGGTEGEVECLIGMPGGDLIAGGLFSNAGSPPVAAPHIARFSGGTWNAMGSGMNSTVWSLAVRPATPAPELYASGTFTLAGSAVTRVARWTGTAWAGTPPNVTGFNDWTWAIAVLPATNTLVVGGAFSTYNGAATRRVAQYAGNTWTALGGGVNTGFEIYELFVMPNGDLIASGNFTQIGGVNARNVARYNGSSWSAMGAGFPLPARDFAVLANGDLYAANVLDEAFGNPAIAKWTGTAWSRVAVASGTIFALLPLSNGDILVGGGFNSVDGLAVNNVAVYRPGSVVPPPQITQQPAPAGVCGLGAAAFTAGASGAITAYQWEWRRVGGPAWTVIVNGLNVGSGASFQATGASTTSLALSGYQEMSPSSGGAVKIEVRLTVSNGSCASTSSNPAALLVNSADFDGDGDIGTDQDIEAFFRCLSGTCCPRCGSSDFNGDGDVGTDQDIESFFRVLAGGNC